MVSEGQPCTAKWKNMIYNYRYKILIRIVFLGLGMFLFIYAIHQKQWYVTSIILATIIIASIVELIYFSENWARELKKFLMSIKHRDFTGFYYNEKLKHSLPEYKFAFKEISREFQHVRIEKELHYQYLQTLTDHIKIALICYKDDDYIEMTNPAANDLFGVHQLRSLDQLKRAAPELYSGIKSFTGKPQIIKTVIKGKLRQLILDRSQFILGSEPLTLVSFRDIKNELEQNELDSWKKLIQVLTHEIMNSATPISSLGKAVLEILDNRERNKTGSITFEKDDFDDLYSSVATIENRGRGMLKFVDDYKNLMNIPQPNFEQVEVMNLIMYTKNLLAPQFESRGIDLEINNEPDGITVFADRDMIERVILNLMLNAMYAMEDVANPKLIIATNKTVSGKILISVSDNGQGIPDENMDKVFVPFFTTRKGGSGLGLGISREIMRLHHGNIEVESIANQGTTIRLLL